MKVILPPPLTQAPPSHSFAQDVKLLLKNQFRVTWNKLRHWPVGTWVAIILVGLSLLSLLVYLGLLAYGALSSMSPDIARGFLSLFFMMGLVGQIFFGITAAFAALYMSEDLELLFLAPIPTRAVFTVKSLVVAGSNFFTVALFVFLPGIFYGLLFQGGFLYYLLVVLAGCGLWIIGTALAELFNIIVMRIVPPHRSREAIGFIGALAGIMVALVFQMPNIIMNSGQTFNINSWLAGQEQLLEAMNYFPWGWSAAALNESLTGNLMSAFGWALLLLAVGLAIFWLSFLLVERGFRRGWISLGEGGGGRKVKKHRSRDIAQRLQAGKQFEILIESQPGMAASPWRGMWAVAKKDMLYMKRDTREWFGYLVPLIIMVFFVGQYLFMQADSTRASLVMILIMYSLMFSGNMALQSFGREGESEWVLNSVPLAGWPVVWGKLLASAIPTIFLMEALLAGTSIAIGLSAVVTLAMAVGAVFLTLGASSIGLFYSINNCRYNPDVPQQRISPGASMLMYLINLVFMGLLALGILYVFPPPELMIVLQEMPPAAELESGFLGFIIYVIYLLTRPFLWQAAVRITAGILIAGGVWSLVFFGFTAGTVHKSRKGFRVEIVTGSKKKQKRLSAR